MKTVYSIPEALPLELPVGKHHSRRQQVAGLQLEDAALLAFNGQLQAVNAQAPSVDADQVASLARWLQDMPADKAEATIALRMARAQALAQMLDDADWQVPEVTARRGRHLIAALRGSENLIPDATPLFGHLDEALMVELCWNGFEGEVGDYMDFRRFRAECSFRGTVEELRTAWETDCVAQASQMLHRQQVRLRGYARPERLEKPFRVC
ncbi:MAG: hypothetical protein ABI588_07710 [Arenimonas sp.]